MSDILSHIYLDLHISRIVLLQWRQQNIGKDSSVAESKESPLLPVSILKQTLCLSFLCDTFPNCFSKTAPKPLKSGVLEDIVDRLGEEMPFSKTLLRKTLSIYCHNFNYLSTVLEIGTRFGLEGKEAETITKEHQDHTKKKLRQLHKHKWNKKKQSKQ